MIIHNVQQKTDDWYKLRLGKFTGSDFHICMSDKETLTKKRMIAKKAAEKITGALSDQDFSSIHIQRGNELEGEAITIYEFEKDVVVEDIGFCELDEYIGCSPDGFVGDDGMIEVKCKDNHSFLQSVIDDKVDPMHMTQIQFNLMVTGRKWCDYVLYNPNFKKYLHVIRVERDQSYIDKIKEKVQECVYIVKNIINELDGNTD